MSNLKAELFSAVADGFERTNSHFWGGMIDHLRREAARSAGGGVECANRWHSRPQTDPAYCPQCWSAHKVPAPTRPTRGEEGVKCRKCGMGGADIHVQISNGAQYSEHRVCPHPGADSQAPNIDALNRVARPEEPARAAAGATRSPERDVIGNGDVAAPAVPTLQDASHVPPLMDDTHLECRCGWRGYFRELLHDKDSQPPQGCCPRCQSQFRWKPIYPEASGTACPAPSKASDSVSASPSPSQEGRAGELRACPKCGSDNPNMPCPAAERGLSCEWSIYKTDEASTAYNAGVISDLEKELLSPWERQRVGNLPRWAQSVLTDLIRRIANLRSNARIRAPLEKPSGEAGGAVSIERNVLARLVQLARGHGYDLMCDDVATRLQSTGGEKT